MAIPDGPSSGPLRGADVSIVRQLLLEGPEQSVEQRFENIKEYIKKREAQAAITTEHKRQEKAGFDRQGGKASRDRAPEPAPVMTTGSGPT